MRGLAVMQGHGSGTVDGRCAAQLPIVRIVPALCLCISAVKTFAGCKSLHAKTLGTIRVQQFQRSNFVFANDSRNARQCELKFFRLRRRRKKKAALRRAWPHRLRPQMNFEDRSSRRMRIQIKLQQLEENFGIQQRHR